MHKNTQLTQYNLKQFALRFLAISVVLMLLMQLVGDFLLTSLLPIFRWEIALISPSFKILHVDLMQKSGELVFWLKVSIAELLIVGGQFVVPNETGTATASTIAGYVLQVSVLFLAILLSAPVAAMKQYAYRLMVGLPVLLLVLMLDTPLALLGAVWDIIYQALYPQKTVFLIEWNRFMVGGGRLVLSLSAAMLVLSCTGAFNGYSSTAKNSPKVANQN